MVAGCPSCCFGGRVFPSWIVRRIGLVVMMRGCCCGDREIGVLIVRQRYCGGVSLTGYDPKITPLIAISRRIYYGATNSIDYNPVIETLVEIVHQMYLHLKKLICYDVM